MGQIFVNLIGWWKEGFSEPMWIMTNLSAEQGLTIYLQRMKIEEAFRDMKSLLGLEKMMHKKRELMEKMVALMLIAYAISLVLGETLRDHCFPKDHPKHNVFSGLLVLLKLKLTLPPSILPPLSVSALAAFSVITTKVRSFV